MNTRELFEQRIAGSLSAISSLREQIPDLAAIAELVIAKLKAGGTIYTAGNGGSAAEAMHLAEELIGRYRGDRAPLRAICLNADPTALTCIANDFGFEKVFARQCEALLTAKDVLIVFSTSGESQNLVEALGVARTKGAATIGLLGKSGGRCRGLCDHSIVIRCNDSAQVQEAHQVALHLLCEAAESA